MVTGSALVVWMAGQRRKKREVRRRKKTRMKLLDVFLVLPLTA